MKTQNFKLKLTLPILFTVMVLCMGCPYESKFPLEGTKVKYDKNLVGTWHQDDIDLKIIRVDDYRFSYVYNDHDEDYGTGEETGTGYAVTNNGATYLVVERDNDGTRSFAIYKVLSIEPGNLAVIPLEEDNIPTSKKFNSAQEFTNYVVTNNSTAFTYANKSEYAKGASSYTGIRTNPNTNTNSNTSNSNQTYSNNNQTYSNNSSYGTVLFKEDYQTRNNDWYSNYDFKDSNYIYIATLDNPNNHYYLFRNRKYKAGYIVPIPYYSIPSSNYSIEINAKHYDGVENAAYGIKFGANTWKNVYNFSIAANGYYAITKRENDVYSEIVPWTTTSAVNTGSATNKLEVRVFSNYTEFYINGQYIRRLDIRTFGSTAGLEVYNNQTIYFDDLSIRSLGAGSSNNNNNNYASSSILFREDYQTHNNNWYSNYSFKDSNYIYINTLDNPSNHFYLFRNRRKSGDGYMVNIPYSSIPNANYSIEIDARHFDGEDQYGYGIKFGASDWNNCYNLNITNNGFYRVSKTDRGSYKNLIAWTKSSALNQGTSTNKLEVRVYYTYVDIYINDQYITRVNDFDRFGNNAGLEVYNYQTIYFDNLVIRKL
ncbi:MAG TPA: hypothetical protein VL095_13975 [Flavisolibacter sp.]|nr:hypothetical protein [Flavisolibacter sp.]